MTDTTQGIRKCKVDDDAPDDATWDVAALGSTDTDDTFLGAPPLGTPGPPVDLWLHPGLSQHGADVFANEANFSPDSAVDVVTITGAAYSRNQNDAQVEEAVEASLKSSDFRTATSNLSQLLYETPDAPASMILCARLEADDNATFDQKASISRPLAEKLFRRFDIHSGFWLDLVGRPNYWAAVSQVKPHPTCDGDVYEFFCQHPRWHQKGRYDQKKKRATQGNKAPCSVYMNYSVTTNTTFYIVVAPDDGIWFSFLERIRLGGAQHYPSLLPPGDLASSPFLVHALIANIAFEQATEYCADVRNKLMSQLKRVNDYADSQANGSPTTGKLGDVDARASLRAITVELHQVSQMLNTGLGSAGSSVALSGKLVGAHAAFCRGTGRGAPGTMVGRTQGMLQYVLDSFLYQKSWLEQYKTRKETAMSFVFNMVTQQDSSVNLQTSRRMSEDSSSMHAITVLTMVFLPGTFTATLFSSVAFRAADGSGAAEVTDWLWPFIGVAVALTLGVLATWYFRRRALGGWGRALACFGERRRARGRMAVGGKVGEMETV